jgi:hypothetical protein
VFSVVVVVVVIVDGRTELDEGTPDNPMVNNSQFNIAPGDGKCKHMLIAAATLSGIILHV